MFVHGSFYISINHTRVNKFIEISRGINIGKDKLYYTLCNIFQQLYSLSNVLFSFDYFYICNTNISFVYFNLGKKLFD